MEDLTERDGQPAAQREPMSSPHQPGAHTAQVGVRIARLIRQIITVAQRRATQAAQKGAQMLPARLANRAIEQGASAGSHAHHRSAATQRDIGR